MLRELWNHVCGRRMKRDSAGDIPPTTGGVVAFHIWPLVGGFEKAIREWAENNLERCIANPYGKGGYQFMVSLVAREHGTHILLWTEQLPRFSAGRAEAFHRFFERVRTAPLSEYPTATHSEASFVSYGAIKRRADRPG